MAPKYLLQFEVDKVIAERGIQVLPDQIVCKQLNPRRYEVGKRWRQVSRKLIMYTAQSAGSSLCWLWELAEFQFHLNALLMSEDTR